jgi:Zn-dependent peptidase ImmA (M78 family)/DNA-binding XRE family transcriptional regulator
VFQPERLTLARKRRGMNKTRLAKAIHVTLQTISAYERGESEPSREYIERLAATLNFPPSFFYRDMVDAVPVDAASFRKLSRMTASQRDAALAAGTLCVELNRWIEERFDLPPQDLPDLNPGLISPEGAAALVRSRWGLGEAPIDNVLHLAEAHGVRVFSLTNECREIDAFSFWRDGIPFVCLGTHKSPERAVFDLAHEIGHLILHRDDSEPRGRAEEKQADAFAAHLLMAPSDVLAVAPRFPTLNDLINAKTRWRVSVAALNFHMHRLGMISDWHYRELCMDISVMGRDVEPNSIPRQHSQVLEQVLRALRAEGTGRADIAAALDIYQQDLDDLMFGLTMSTIDGGGESAAQNRPVLRLL